MKLRQYIIFFSLLFIHYYSFGQFPRNTNNSNLNTGNALSGDYVPVPDTFGVFYFFLDNPNQDQVLNDTSLTHFEINRPTHKRDFEYTDLGNTGSAYQPLFFEPSFRRGIDIGLHQFDMYQLTKDNSPLYRVNKPFSRAYYAQYDKNNFSFQGEFSRNFTERLNFSVMTLRSHHNGQFRDQKAKNNAFTSTLWYQGKKKKYEAYLTITANSNAHADNGGVDTSQLIAPFINIPISIQVLRENGIANTLQTQRSVSYTQYYQFNPKAIPNKIYIPKKTAKPSKKQNTAKTKKDVDLKNKRSKPSNNLKNEPLATDSIPATSDSLLHAQKVQDSIAAQVYTEKYAYNGSRALMLGHQISYENRAYRASDTDPDSSYYQPLYYTHQGGLRAFIRHQSITNDFKLSSFKVKKDADKSLQQRDLSTIGLVHSFHIIRQNPTKTYKNNLFLYGRFHFRPSQQIHIQTYAHYGLLANFSDYRVEGKLRYGLPKIGNLAIALVQQAYSPSWLSESFYVSETAVWKKDFKKTFETRLSATYSLPQYRLEISGHYNLINNYLYYDNSSTPQQISQGISIGQLMVKKDFKFWKFHLDNKIILQQTSNDLVRLPQFLVHHSLYFAGYVYKKALYSHIGVNFRMHNAYNGNGYFALTGQFHLQDQQTNISYPMLDAFVNIQVKEFRLFLKYQNLTKLWDSSIYYATVGHLERYNSIQFGVSWNFLN